jgi:hypothetical protein
MNKRNVCFILLLVAAGTSVSFAQFTRKETLKAILTVNAFSSTG